MEWNRIILSQSRNLILLIPKFNFCVHTKPQLDHNLIQINPVQSLNTILYLSFSTRLICLTYVTLRHPTSPSVICHTNNILCTGQTVKFLRLPLSASLPLSEIQTYVSPRIPVFKQTLIPYINFHF